MSPSSRSLTARAVAVAALTVVSCRQPTAIAPAPAPAPATAPTVQAQVLDAFGAGDRAWAYVDGRELRQAGLSELLHAVSALRADVEVGLGAAALQCGFQPFLAIDELLLRVRWTGDERAQAWAAVLRMQEPLDRNLYCLLALVPGAQETSLDGRRAWQIHRAFVALDDGLFVVANSAPEVQATMARMAHPEPAALQARAALAGTWLSANVAGQSPFGVEALGVRWTPQASGSRLELHAGFTGETSARQTESILRDGLLQLLGSNASFEPATQGVAERFVKGATVNRDGSKLDANFDMPPLAGQTAFVSVLTSLAVRGAQLRTAWDLTSEARETVYAIARALADYAIRVRAPGHPVHFPPSAPLVPDDIPYGKRVVPNPHSFLHPSWQDIRFSSDRPTYYAFDFVTAKDGRSVVVRARGDIDGDGTTSLFELDVRLDAHDAPIVAPMIRERDPSE